VTDNGVAKPITEFEQHTLAGLPQKAELQPAKETATLASTSLPAERMGRKFFLFFDFVYNTQRGIRKAKEAALNFLDGGLLPTDEVAVMSYSDVKGFKLNEFLSSDHRRVRKTVEALDTGDIAGWAANLEEEVLNQFNESGREDPTFEPWKKPWIKFEGNRQESKNLALNYLENLTALAKALGFIPGQKQMIFFSSGMPTSLMQGLASQTKSTPPSMINWGDPILRNANAEMHKAMNSANCTIFAFDTRGNDIDLFSKYARESADTIFSPTVTTGQGTLREVAKATGGKYFGNINEYQTSLDELQNLTGTYYVLGYYITEQWDGRYHKIKVEMKKKGYDVHAQAGYFNPKPFREYSDLEKKLHLFDLALSERPMFQTPLAFSLRTLVFADKDESLLLMLSKIPAEAIDKFSGKKVELVSLVFDEEENLADLQRQETDLTKYRGMDVFTSSEIALKSGAYRCRLVIRDLDTGTAAVAYGRASVPAKSAKAISLYSPFLLIQGSNFAYLEGAVKKKNPAIWKSIYPYDRARYSPLMGGLARGTSQFYAVAPCLIAGIGKPNITYTAALINKALGEKTFLPVSTMEKSRRGDVETSFLEFSLNKVAPGEYIFYIFAEDTAARASSYAQTTLIIE
jgi:VWFA-related protein